MLITIKRAACAATLILCASALVSAPASAEPNRGRSPACDRALLDMQDSISRFNAGDSSAGVLAQLIATRISLDCDLR